MDMHATVTMKEYAFVDRVPSLVDWLREELVASWRGARSGARAGRLLSALLAVLAEARSGAGADRCGRLRERAQPAYKSRFA